MRFIIHNSRSNCKLLIGAVLATAFANPAFADDDEALSNEQLKQKITTSTSDGLAGRLRPMAQIRASNDGTNGTITLSTENDTEFGLGSQSFALTISAPISKDTKRADFVTETGLPSTLSAQISFTQVLINAPPFANAREVFELGQKSDDNCRKMAASEKIAPDKVPEYCQSTMGYGTEGKKLFLSDNEKKSLYAYYSQDRDEIAKSPYFAFNINGALGTDKFTFYDNATLAETKDRKMDYAVGASFGYLPSLKSNIFIVGGFEFKRSHTAATSQTFCPVGGPGPTVQCVTGAFSTPTSEIDRKVFTKFRFTNALKLAKKGGMPISFELSAAYDFKDDSWGVEAPVYLFADIKNNLMGGVRFAYDSKEDDFTAGLFVGLAFDFLKL